MGGSRTKGGALSARQQRFVDEYLVDCNATQAAIRAGYSEHTATPAASRLLTNVNVQRAVDAAKAERSERTKLTQDYIVQRLKRYVDAEPEEAETPQLDFWSEPKDETAKPQRRSTVRHEHVLKAAELLGKHLQMFTERVHHTGHVTTCNVIDPYAKSPKKGGDA